MEISVTYFCGKSVVHKGRCSCKNEQEVCLYPSTAILILLDVRFCQDVVFYRPFTPDIESLLAKMSRFISEVDVNG